MPRLAPVMRYALAAQSVIAVLTDDFATAMFWSVAAGAAACGVRSLSRQETV